MAVMFFMCATQVTVTAENYLAAQKLKGYCTFRVNIIDVNDHHPRFELNQYDVNVLMSSTLPAVS